MTEADVGGHNEKFSLEYEQKRGLFRIDATGKMEMPLYSRGCNMSYPNPADSTVILVEDESNVRDALETLLAAADYRCISFASGEAFLEAPLPNIPRCLLLDQRLDGWTGLDVQNELNTQQVPLPVVFVSGEGSINHAVQAIKAGAMDFLEKPVEPELLLERVERALQSSMEGQHRRASTEHDAALLARLTGREREILALLVEGNLNKEVAHILGISTRTVETHRMHIMEKLEAHALADVIHVWFNGKDAIH